MSDFTERVMERIEEAVVNGEFNEVMDSGAREDFETGSRRDTRDGKGRYDLLPPYAIGRLARHFENGARKYGDRNWEKGQPLMRYVDSALRHLFKFQEGSNDEDHLIAAAWNILAFVETENRIFEGQLAESLDDRPQNGKISIPVESAEPASISPIESI